MQQIALKEAGARLAELIGMVTDGEEVIITKDDGSAFKSLIRNSEVPKDLSEWQTTLTNLLKTLRNTCREAFA